MKKIIHVTTLDWKEDGEARHWIIKYQKSKFKVYSYDTESDAWLLLAIKGGNITSNDLDLYMYPGYRDISKLRLIKPIVEKKLRGESYMTSKDKEFGGVF